MSVNLPDWIQDRRMDPPQGIVGDSWNWYATEPTAAKKSLVIHHSASPTNQDGGVIAQHHVNKGWGGIGYHFVIRHDSHPNGAGIEYVGDLITWRAGTENDNNGRVHICLVGNFLNHTPGKRQLELTRQLIDYFIAPNFVLPSISYYSQVLAHGLMGGQSTACPGHAAPWFYDWYEYLQDKRGFPHHFYAPPTPPPAPAPTPVEVPVVPTVEIPVEVVQKPEWERTWDASPKPPKVVAVPQAEVFSFPQNKVVKTLPGGELISNIAGTFTVGGVSYVQTQFSADRALFNGILESELKEPDAPPSPVINPSPNPGGVIDGVQPPPDDDLINYNDPLDPPELPETPELLLDARDWFKSFYQVLLGIVLSILRPIGRLYKLTQRNK